MKKVLSVLLVLMLVFTLISCENNNTNENVVANESISANDNINSNENNNVNSETANEVTEEPVEDVFTFIDGKGREVTIDSEPMRVVTLAPSMTEMVYALGLGDKLVGRTKYCNYPEEALTVENVGSLTEPNIESIIALNPDLVLMSTHASEEVVAKFDEAGLKVAILTQQESFDGVYTLIEQMGMIFSAQEAAEVLVTDMKNDVAEVLALVEGIEKKSVYYVVGYGEYGDYTATGDTFIHEMLEMAGGSNIASDGTSWSYNMESIIEKDPEYLICSELNDTKTDLETTEGYKELTAVKEGRLVEINQDLLSRQGPRLANGLFAIAKILHPELFE